jgi:hypothetical protein
MLKRIILMFGVNNVRFIVPCRPLQDFGFVVLTSSSDEPVMTMCEINEDRYKVEDGYKITVTPINPDSNMESHHFYQSDLSTLLNDGVGFEMYVRYEEEGYLTRFDYDNTSSFLSDLTRDNA